ncbi:MAG: hypothetical protein AB7L09_15680 [Nitrospira sp.]
MEINASQPEIPTALPVLGRFLTFGTLAEPDLRSALKRRRSGFSTEWRLVGEPMVRTLGQDVAHRVLPGLDNPSCTIPSTQPGRWIFLRGKEHGDFVNRTEQRRSFLNEAFELDGALDISSLSGFAWIIQAKRVNGNAGG